MAAGLAPLEPLNDARVGLSDPGCEVPRSGDMSGPDIRVATRQPGRTHPRGADEGGVVEGGDVAGLVEVGVKGDAGSAEVMECDLVERPGACRGEKILTAPAGSRPVVEVEGCR